MAISIRTEASVRANRIGDFEALQERLFNLSRNQPGFQGGALLCSQSHPLIYSRISVWDDMSAVKAFWKGEVFRDFVEHVPDDISTFTRPMECYELIETVRDPGTPAVVVMGERTLRPAALNDYVASRQELFKLQRSEGRGAVIILRDPSPNAVSERLRARRAGTGSSTGLGAASSTGPKQLRQYGVGAQILANLGIHELVLLTNSPDSVYVGLEGFGLKIVEQRRIG